MIHEYILKTELNSDYLNFMKKSLKINSPITEIEDKSNPDKLFFELSYECFQYFEYHSFFKYETTKYFGYSLWGYGIKRIPGNISYVYVDNQLWGKIYLNRKLTMGDKLKALKELME